jgi:hypothetical protein
MVDKIASRKMDIALKGMDKNDQLQSYIHSDLDFKRNSINILISRRGVGKTFSVMKELIKSSRLPDHSNHSQFIYVADKLNDSTVNELIKLVKIRSRVINYDNAYNILKDIMDTKTAYEQVIEKNLMNKLTEKSGENISNTFDIEEFSDGVPHSIIFFDDAINIFNGNKYKQLKNLLFQNRQPRFTIFICLQDLFSIPPQIKRNADSIWIFTGFTDKMMFNILCKQFGSPVPAEELWDIYQQFEYRNAIIFVYDPDGIKINILNS